LRCINRCMCRIVSCSTVQGRETACSPGSCHGPSNSVPSYANPCVPSLSLHPLFPISKLATCGIRPPPICSCICPRSHPHLSSAPTPHSSTLAHSFLLPLRTHALACL
jgi:hypothetical protein